MKSYIFILVLTIQAFMAIGQSAQILYQSWLDPDEFKRISAIVPDYQNGLIVLDHEQVTDFANGGGPPKMRITKLDANLDIEWRTPLPTSLRLPKIVLSGGTYKLIQSQLELDDYKDAVLHAITIVISADGTYQDSTNIEFPKLSIRDHKVINWRSVTMLDCCSDEVRFIRSKDNTQTQKSGEAIDIVHELLVYSKEGELLKHVDVSHLTFNNSTIWGRNNVDEWITWNNYKNHQLRSRGILYQLRGKAYQTEDEAGHIQVQKFNKDLELIWSDTIGGNKNEFITGFVHVKGGGFIACGATSSNKGVYVNNEGSFDGLVLKFNEDGRLANTITIGDARSNYISQIQAYDQGYLALMVNFGDFPSDKKIVVKLSDRTADSMTETHTLCYLDNYGNVIWKKPLAGLPKDLSNGSLIISKEQKVFINGSVNEARGQWIAELEIKH